MHAGSRGCRRGLPAEQVDLAVEVFRMLAEPTRVRVLWALVDREMPVHELAELVGKPPTSVSQHLAKLRMARLVRTRRDGTQVFYRLDNDHVARLVTDAVCNAEHAGPGIPGHHQDDPTLTRLHVGAESGERTPRDPGRDNAGAVLPGSTKPGR